MNARHVPPFRFPSRYWRPAPPPRFTVDSLVVAVCVAALVVAMAAGWIG